MVDKLIDLVGIRHMLIMSQAQLRLCPRQNYKYYRLFQIITVGETMHFFVTLYGTYVSYKYENL